MSSLGGIGRTRRALLTLTIAVVGCAPNTAPRAPTPAEPPSTGPSPAVVPPEPKAPPLPELPSGDLPPLEVPEPVAAKVLAAEQSEGFRTLLLEVPIEQAMTLGFSEFGPVFARVTGSFTSPAVLAGDEVEKLGVGKPSNALRLWVRYEVSPVPPSSTDSSPSDLIVEVFTAVEPDGANPYSYESDVADEERSMFDSGGGAQGRLLQGRHGRLVANLPAKINAQPKVSLAYLRALGAQEKDTPVGWLLAPEEGGQTGRVGQDSVVREWRDLMRFSTGYDSVEAALVTEQQLRAPVSPQSASVPFSQLASPELRQHPWATMLEKLKEVTAPEPLAAMIPAEFYYARARSFAAFQGLLDRVEDILTPGVRVLEQHRQQLDLSARYRLELGLTQDELSRVMGPHLVHSLVLTGSDPMLRQGSDLSLVLEVPNSSAVLNVLAAKRAQLSQSHPLTASNWSHESIAVASFASEDGLVRQEVASFKRGDGKEFVLVSNSKNAVRRILSTWLGKHAPLTDELDFQYMLRRDPRAAEDVLVYMGDRFVAEVVSPRQRILDSRRQVARAELATVGYGALLFGELYGRLPESANELGAKAWFGMGRLRHASGDAIRYDRSAGVASSWGTARRLTSIIDMPTPTRVSRAEEAAYREFAQQYEWQWGERIDPIALRVKVNEADLEMFLRVLPLVNSSDYSDIVRWSGGGSSARQASLPGVAGVLAIGAGSPLREFLSGNGRSFLGDKFKLDWLGDWVELGLADDRALASAVLDVGELPMPPSAARPTPSNGDVGVIDSFPLYLVVDIASAAGASVMLTILRELATGAAPDAVQWSEYKKHAGATIVRVHVEDVSLYYALTKKRLLVALQSEVLERLLEGLNRGDASPVQAMQDVGSNGLASGQLVIDVAPESHSAPSLLAASAIRTVAAWLFEKAVRQTGVDNPAATMLLQGAFREAPSEEEYRDAAYRWLGSVPVTADGKPYIATPSGVADPERGNAYHPRWPKVPVTPGPLATLLQSVLGLRTTISVDEEPGDSEARSLRASGRLRLRQP